MDARQDRLGSAQIALDEREKLARFGGDLVDDCLPLGAGHVERQRVLGHAAHQALGLQAVLDEVGDGDDDAGRARSAKRSRSGMRAIVPSSFMISQITPAGVQPGEARQIDRAFGLAGAHQHAAAPRAQREHVARA